MKNTREAETAVEKEKRNAANRDNMNNVREAETIDEKEKRNTADKDNKRNIRKDETSVEKDKRNSADRDYKKKVRDDRNVLRATRIDVAPFSVGLMNQVCSCCSSLMFAGETHSGKLGVNGEPGSASFSMCCR